MMCGTWHGMEEFTMMCDSIVDVAVVVQRTWHGGVHEWRGGEVGGGGGVAGWGDSSTDSL